MRQYVYAVPERMTRRFAAVVIGTQGLAVFFWALVANRLAAVHGESQSTALLVVGLVVAALCVLDAGLLRRPWGLTLGWVLQLCTLAMSVIVPAMLIVAIVFLALWLAALVQGHRMDDLTAAFLAHQQQEGGQAEPTSRASSSPGATSHEEDSRAG
ncbi:MAG TPA: DUF4233 domain-containing protein [Segeticoccus sp.]|uniref:DUF4233 domain-containing protein n=1 Tax=Segeticoccus sp. TaxID=2706531 RepID=UPI002D7E9AA9|nr:DUF4233 domain-containing protein [Segeticoccus sp.]HET8601386.1 DUF4233 domain-containing protein [Segeticoccus sp.]